MDQTDLIVQMSYSHNHDPGCMTPSLCELPTVTVHELNDPQHPTGLYRLITGPTSFAFIVFEPPAGPSILGAPTDPTPLGRLLGRAGAQADATGMTCTMFIVGGQGSNVALGESEHIGPSALTDSRKS